MSTSHINRVRLIGALAGFVSAIVAPPWVTVVIIVALSLRYRAPEVIVMGLITDLAWLPHGGEHVFPIFTLIAIIIAWGLEPLRVELMQ